MTTLLTDVENQIRNIVGHDWDDATIEAEAVRVVTSVCDTWHELEMDEPIGRIEVYAITGYGRPTRARGWLRGLKSWLN